MESDSCPSRDTLNIYRKKNKKPQLVENNNYNVIGEKIKCFQPLYLIVLNQMNDKKMLI